MADYLPYSRTQQALGDLGTTVRSIAARRAAQNTAEFRDKLTLRKLSLRGKQIEGEQKINLAKTRYDIGRQEKADVIAEEQRGYAKEREVRAKEDHERQMAATADTTLRDIFTEAADGKLDPEFKAYLDNSGRGDMPMTRSRARELAQNLAGDFQKWQTEGPLSAEDREMNQRDWLDKQHDAIVKLEQYKISLSKTKPSSGSEISEMVDKMGASKIERQALGEAGMEDVTIPEGGVYPPLVKRRMEQLIDEQVRRRKANINYMQKQWGKTIESTSDILSKRYPNAKGGDAVQGSDGKMYYFGKPEGSDTGVWGTFDETPE